jgi:hypothetical protein
VKNIAEAIAFIALLTFIFLLIYLAHHHWTF